MPSGSINTVVSIGGISMSSTISRTESGQISHQPSALAAGKESTDWSKTDANTGDATLASGHGISSGDMVDVYWPDGVRYGMNASVASLVVTVDGGAGDDLPVDDTVMVVSPIVQIDSDFDGDLVSILGVMSTKRGHVNFRSVETSGVGGALLAQELLANEAYTWASNIGVTNPLTGDPVARIDVSNGDPDDEATIKIVALYDSEV